MEYQQLASFVEVAKLLNFSKAADKLHITQSTMSARIQKLENELGVPLFIRLGKTIRLSKYGETLLPYALQSIQAMNKGIKKMEEQKTDHSRRLTFSAANPFAAIFLPHILTALHTNVPEISIQVLRNTGYSDEMYKMVLESQIHFAFINDPNDPSVHAEESPVCMIPLYEDDFVLVARPSHPLTALSGVTITDLAKYQLLFMGQKTSISKHMIRHFEHQQMKREEVVEINSIPGIKEMLKKTDMVTFFPRLVVMGDIEKQELAQIPMKQPARSFVTYLACQHNEIEPHLLTIIKDTVEATIHELGLPCRMFH